MIAEISLTDEPAQIGVVRRTAGLARAAESPLWRCSWIGEVEIEGQAGIGGVVIAAPGRTAENEM